MTPDELAAIKARAAAATPGPWEPKSYCGRQGGGVEPFDSTATAGLGFEVEGPPYPMLDRYRFESGLDAVFIAAARTDVPELAAEVERLRRGLEMVIAYDEDEGVLTQIAQETLDDRTDGEWWHPEP